MKTTTRLGGVLLISVAFFGVEIAVGFKTKSLALIADAFHYLNDIVAYGIAFAAAYLQEQGRSPESFTYAFHRGELVGAFFNATFLLALALSIFLQSLERFISPQVVDHPLQVLIVGAYGTVYKDYVSYYLLIQGDQGGASHGHSHGGDPHGHSHETPTEIAMETLGSENIHALHNHVRLPLKPPASRNLGIAGVIVHLCGDAVNNLGVILAATIMYKLRSPNRFYADPATSMFISLVIFGSAIPLAKKTARILLEAAPDHLDLKHVKDDLSTVPGVNSIHDLHVWHLSQFVILASLHVRTSASTLEEWQKIEADLRDCLSAYGVKHVTVSPELQTVEQSQVETVGSVKTVVATGCERHGAGCGAEADVPTLRLHGGPRNAAQGEV